MMRLIQGIEKLMLKQNLNALDCEAIFNDFLRPDFSPLQTAAFLVLMHAKTETVDELTGMVCALKEKMVSLSMPYRVLDIVGTGGDRTGTINISTASAILAASCGIKIAKHGNSAVTSKSGSADVLQALGIQINLPPEKVRASINEIGIGFCFSPNFHPAMHALCLLRRELNVPTSFNLLGPLLNPASPQHHLLGVYDSALIPLIAETLQKLGTQRSLVVHGAGMDELSCAGPIKMVEVTPDKMLESCFDAQDFGFPRCYLADLRGGSPMENALIIQEIFSGNYTSKLAPIAHTFILNAAIAIYLYGLHCSIEDAVRHAKEQLHQGAALDLIKKWRKHSHD